MKLKYVYLLLFIIGTIAPLYQFYGFLAAYGVDMGLFFKELLVNNVSSFFAMDVFISAIATIVLIVEETSRRRVKYFWLSIAALLSVGVSSGLPLYLYLRSNINENNDNLAKYGG